jgi:hypothetical protein
MPAALLHERLAMPSGNYAAISVEELKKEILRRQRALVQLIARREALDELIVALQGLSDVHGRPNHLKRNPEKNRARGTQGTMDAGGSAGKPALEGELAEVSQSKEIGSLAEQILLGDKNRLGSALGVFGNGRAPQRLGENDRGRSALSMNAAEAKLHVAAKSGPEPGAPGPDEAGPAARPSEGTAKVRVLRAITYEDILLPPMT